VPKITLEVPEELSQQLATVGDRLPELLALSLQQRRDELLKEITQAENDYAQGNVRRGSVADLMALDES
jgi:hypothetical protein